MDLLLPTLPHERRKGFHHLYRAAAPHATDECVLVMVAFRRDAKVTSFQEKGGAGNDIFICH
ncbi:hypothetical protein [Micromonospora sp. NPDC005806]|uniref:hypothetical protein n=1 Tax=Micromonospora sp. NPDC005806 TaxID=3364234 RepID=UPI0036CBDFB5